MSEAVNFVDVLQAARVIELTKLQELSTMAHSSGISLEELIERDEIIPQSLLASIKLGLTLINNQSITKEQFAIAIFDQFTTGVLMTESLQIRGWIKPD